MGGPGSGRRKLEYQITGDNSQLKKKLKESTVDAESLEKAINGAGKKLAELAAFYEGISFLKDSFKAFVEAETSIDNLKQAIGKNGGLVSDLQELVKLNEELESKGIFSHKALEQAEAMGETAGLTGKKLEVAIVAATDFAARKHLDLNTVMGELIKAQTGRLGGDLREAGIVIDKNASSTQKWTSIISQLQAKFQGANEEIASTTTAGAIAQMSNDWEKFKEDIGEGLAEAFKTLRPYLTEAIDKLKTMVGWVKQHKEQIIAVAKPLAVFVGIIVTIIGLVKSWAAAQTLLDIALAPISLWVIGIAALGTAIYEAYQNFEGFRDVVNGVWNAIKYLFGYDITGSPLMNSLKEDGPLSTALNAIKLIIDTIKDSLDALYAIFNNKAYNVKFSAAGIEWNETEESKFAHADYSGGNGIKGGLGEFLAKKEQERISGTASIGKKTNVGIPSTPDKKEIAKEAITINITKLVESLNLHTVTLKEGAQEIKEIIGTAIQEAVYGVRYATGR